MRLLVVVLMSGCSLYFPSRSPVQDDAAVPPTEIPPDGGDGGESCPVFYFCDGTTIYQASIQHDGSECGVPSKQDSLVVGSCPNGCAYDSFYQAGEPCLGPAPRVFECTQAGACSAGETDACAAPLACGQVVSTGSCSCANGTWSCAAACADGLCSANDVQAALAGHWTGTVTPPSFAQPYQIDLHIAADGAWSATATSANGIPFYYGDDGGGVGSRIVVQAQTTVGAYASIGLFGGEVQGLFTAVHVDAHHLTFAFVDSWLSCSRTFYFDLHR